MTVILIISLLYLSGCIYMMRGGSPCFQLFSKPFGQINPENGLYKVPRWATVFMQLLVIAPFVIYFHLNWWIIIWYPVGWYLTIFKGWSEYYDIANLKEAGQFFLRMSMAILLFYPLSCLNGNYNPCFAIFYTAFFAALTVAVYKLYSMEEGHTDFDFNWSEFITGINLAFLSFSLLGGV